MPVCFQNSYAEAGQQLGIWPSTTTSKIIFSCAQESNWCFNNNNVCITTRPRQYYNDGWWLF